MRLWHYHADPAVQDLRDCERNMDLDEERADPQEVKARRQLIDLCKQIASEYGDADLG